MVERCGQWINQKEVGAYASRRDAPVLLVEQFALAGWRRAGEPVCLMAARLRRPIPQVRSMAFD